MSFVNKFGIEIEMAGISCFYMERALRKNNISACGGHGFADSFWTAKEDGSICGDGNPENCPYMNEPCNDCDICETDPDECPFMNTEPCMGCDTCCGEDIFCCELVSPPLLFCNDSLEQIKKVCDIAKKSAAYTNDSCGLHVHVDATWLRRWKPRNQKAFFKYISKMYWNFENTFDARMSEKRRGDKNDYCHTMQYYEHNFGDRYYKLNTQAFIQHGTIEFRHHHGTLDAEEIIEWVKACLLFVNIARSTFRSKKQAKEYIAESNNVMQNHPCNYL